MSPKSSQKNNQQDQKIIALQVEIAYIKEDVQDIKRNHLPHLQEKIEAIDRKLAYYAGGLAVLIFFIEFILRFIK